jgi:hypothetical protein
MVKMILIFASELWISLAKLLNIMQNLDFAPTKPSKLYYQMEWVTVGSIQDYLNVFIELMGSQAGKPLEAI